jgi:sugar phosphate isomerase/epimerase
VTPRGVATALYGWMERFRREGVEWDWRTLYGACAQAGVDAVETDPLPEKLAILRDLGLAVSASYVGMPLHTAVPDAALRERVLPVAERLAAAGGRDLILNADPIEGAPPKTDDDARRQGEAMSRVASLVEPLGLAVSMHNHAADPAQAELDLRSVIAYADARVGLCIDTGWALVAGADPVAWARSHGDRVRALHLRDIDGRGIPTEALGSEAPGTGRLDLAALLAALPRFDGWLTLELWHPDAMKPSVSFVEANRRSAALLRALA